MKRTGTSVNDCITNKLTDIKCTTKVRICFTAVEIGLPKLGNYCLECTHAQASAQFVHSMHICLQYLVQTVFVICSTVIKIFQQTSITRFSPNNSSVYLFTWRCMLWSWVFHIFFLLVCYIHSMTACTYKNYQESMNSTCRRYYELQKPSHSIWSLRSQKIKRILLAVHWMHTVTELSYYVIKSRQRNTTILPQWNTYQEKYSWFMKTRWN